MAFLGSLFHPEHFEFTQFWGSKSPFTIHHKKMAGKGGMEGGDSVPLSTEAQLNFLVPGCSSLVWVRVSWGGGVPARHVSPPKWKLVQALVSGHGPQQQKPTTN